MLKIKHCNQLILINYRKKDKEIYTLFRKNIDDVTIPDAIIEQIRFSRTKEKLFRKSFRILYICDAIIVLSLDSRQVALTLAKRKANR